MPAGKQWREVLVTAGVGMSHSPGRPGDPQLLQEPPIPPGTPNTHQDPLLFQDPNSTGTSPPLGPPSPPGPQFHWNPPFPHSQSPALLPQLCAGQTISISIPNPFYSPFPPQGLNSSEGWSIPVSSSPVSQPRLAAGPGLRLDSKHKSHLTAYFAFPFPFPGRNLSQLLSAGGWTNLQEDLQVLCPNPAVLGCPWGSESPGNLGGISPNPSSSGWKENPFGERGNER